MVTAYITQGHSRNLNIRHKEKKVSILNTSHLEICSKLVKARMCRNTMRIVRGVRHCPRSLISVSIEFSL